MSGWQHKEELALRSSLSLDRDWIFQGPNKTEEKIDLPHTWNAQDGQDGGNDYWRGSCKYTKKLPRPAYDPETQRVYLEFCGVNATADATLNGQSVAHHDGGYSTFRVDVTDVLQDENLLEVVADNSVNDRVYPQKADFTFYGGIYRDVNILVVNKNHFDLDYCGGPGLWVTPEVEGENARVRIQCHTNVEHPQVVAEITDIEGKVVAQGEGTDVTLTIPQVHLWNGVKDPYLYRATLRLMENGQPVDEISTRFGVRTFHVDPKKGFFLNGHSYPLHGVSRHQDRKGLGNALKKEHHDEDMALIREIGANTIRLAHYQHDQYFYDLCDEAGMIVWAEIPYISEHLPNGRENTISQMKELIVQNYNHPSIVTWGLSNEITISTKDKKDMLDNHRELNELCHKMDPSRPTTLACYAVCGPFNPVAHLSDLVSWNLYLGWYVPGLFLNDLWISFFHLCYPKRCLGYSEYGCEGMPNLHSAHPRRGDHTEEYQAKYHEFMLKCFQRHPYMWSTHVWNMFDFAADARDQGGEPGMNHKGLVTFDRQTKKDSFYLYKAYWSEVPFLHLAGKRFVNRTGRTTQIKVYTNQPKVALYVGDKLVAEKTGDKVFTFRVPLTEDMKVTVRAGELSDTAVFQRVSKADPAYKLQKSGSSANWV